MGFVADALGSAAKWGSGIGELQAIAPHNSFQAQGNYGPGIAQAQTGALDQSGQQSFIQALQKQMAGQGPSVAQGMLQQATDANNANAASMIGSARGMNPAMQARMIMDQQARNQQQMAGQASTMRAGEMLGAQGQLGNALNSMRGQNIGALGTLGGMQQGVDTTNAGIAGQNAQLQGQMFGGAMGGLGAAMAMSPGGAVPGHAAVHGDSPKNDTVPIQASPGEIVIPRSIAQAEDAPEKAAAFVRAIRRQKGPEGGYGAVLSKVRELKGHLDKLEKMCSGGKVQ